MASFGRFSTSKYGPRILAVLGVIVFIWLSWVTAIQTPGVLDEGSYLYKGYLFASGEYKPFEDYGPQTGKMPLSFLPYGYSQLIFGPGLATGRYTAIFFGLMMLIPLWSITKRFSGEWWAAAAIWVVALNGTSLLNYSLAVSQPVVICLLAWSLYFVLGKNQSAVKVLIGVFLGTLLVFTRINMAVVSFLIVCYVFWEHGKKTGIQALLIWVGVLLVGHLIYWPDIMKIWVPWLPPKYSPSLGEYRLSREGVTGYLWDPASSILGRIRSFFTAVRSDFAPVVGWIAVVFLWPKLRNGDREELKKVNIFLFISFSILLFMHVWASLGKDYCVYCLENYLRFFEIIGILLVILRLPSLNRQPPKIVQVIIIAVFILILVGMFFSEFSVIGDFALDIPVPRVSGGRLQQGFATVWAILSNKFNLEIVAAKQIASSLLGFGIAIVVLILGGIFYRKYFRRKENSKSGFTYYLLVGFLVIGTPLTLFTSINFNREEKNILEAHKLVGEYLQEHIRDGSTVYWDGGNDASPLLYITDAKPYLPQINGDYTFIFGGDPDELLKHGYWNEVLSQQWKDEAQYFIIEQASYHKWKDFFDPDVFIEFPRSPVTLSYEEGSRLRIFRRKP